MILSRSSNQCVIWLLVFQFIILVFYFSNVLFLGADELRFFNKLKASVFYYALVVILSTAIIILSCTLKITMILKVVIFSTFCIIGYFILTNIAVEYIRPLILEMHGSLEPDVFTVENDHPQSEVIHKVNSLTFSDALAWNLVNAYLWFLLIVGNLFIFIGSRRKTNSPKEPRLD